MTVGLFGIIEAAVTCGMMQVLVRLPAADMEPSTPYPHPRHTLADAMGAIAKERDRLVAVAAALGYGSPTVELEQFTVDRGGMIAFRGQLDDRRHVYLGEVIGNPTYGYDDLVSGAAKRIEEKLQFGVASLKARPQLKLYWCESEGHDEDWFVVARFIRRARRFQEQDDPGPIDAELIATLPPAWQKVDDEVFNDSSQLARCGAGWPTLDTIRACGGVIERESQPRVVVIGGRQFNEGMLDFVIDRAWEPFKIGPQPKKPPTPQA